jgi:hypothetical protein
MAIYLANQLFNHIFKCDHSKDTVFTSRVVRHKSHVAAALLEEV